MAKWTFDIRDGIEDAITASIYQLKYQPDKPYEVMDMTDEFAAADRAVDEYLTVHRHIDGEQLESVVFAAVAR